MLICCFGSSFSLRPADDKPVGCFPPWCGWQRGLQEHLLRHHTRRGEGGVKKSSASLKTAYLHSHPFSEPQSLHTIPIFSTMTAPLHISTPRAHSFQFASYLLKRLVALMETLGERTEGFRGCLRVSTYQQGNMGSLVTLKTLSLSLSLRLLFSPNFLSTHSVFLGWGQQCQASCLHAVCVHVQANACTCTRQSSNKSWVPWCLHKSLAWNKQESWPPSGLLVSTRHRVFAGFVLRLVSEKCTAVPR